VRVLILGLSSIASRRVVPALLALGNVEGIDVATKKAASGDQIDWPHGRVFEDYAAALDHSEATAVYISLVNSEHGPWTEAALRRGRHVVVDKPAFLGLDVTERMLELATKQDVCLAEATVVGYHPQVRFLHDQFAASGGGPTRINATLSFPPMDPANFRYRRSLGGGALWDLGPYASVLGRLFYEDEPRDLCCQVLARGGADAADIAFSMMAGFADGRSIAGHFGFDTVYRNRLDAIGSELGADMDRFFTTLPDMQNDVRLTTKAGTTTVAAPAGDAFGCFFAHVFASIADRRWGQLADDLHQDARTLERLRQAAGVL